MKRITCIILLLIGLLFVGVKYHELQEKYHDQEATITKLKKEKVRSQLSYLSHKLIVTEKRW
ncbi:hypothetical protein ODV99_08055 [Enterococcus faecium]|nr:hypothetical protein [Enterococcus faecium]